MKILGYIWWVICKLTKLFCYLALIFVAVMYIAAFANGIWIDSIQGLLQGIYDAGGIFVFLIYGIPIALVTLLVVGLLAILSWDSYLKERGGRKKSWYIISYKGTSKLSSRTKGPMLRRQAVKKKKEADKAPHLHAYTHEIVHERNLPGGSYR